MAYECIDQIPLSRLKSFGIFAICYVPTLIKSLKFLPIWMYIGRAQKNPKKTGHEGEIGGDQTAQHRRFETVKQRGNPGHGAVSGIDKAQPQQDKDGRQEETNPRGQATRHPVQQPADIDGQLDGLRPG